VAVSERRFQRVNSRVALGRQRVERGELLVDGRSRRLRLTRDRGTP
jgi:hypothetical protein